VHLAVGCKGTSISDNGRFGKIRDSHRFGFGYVSSSSSLHPGGRKNSGIFIADKGDGSTAMPISRARSADGTVHEACECSVGEFPSVVLFIAYGPVKSLGMGAGENGKVNDSQELVGFRILHMGIIPQKSRFSSFLMDYP